MLWHYEMMAFLFVVCWAFGKYRKEAKILVKENHKRIMEGWEHLNTKVIVYESSKQHFLYMLLEVYE